MTWDLEPVAHAIADLLGAIDATVKAYPAAPETFNPPAYVVGWPSTVDYDIQQFGIDVATIPVAAAAGVEEIDRVDQLLDAARKAIDADLSLGGTVQYARTATQTNWRPMRVAGIDMLLADLIVEIRM